VRSFGRVAENTRVGIFQRLLFALIGLLAGNAALLLYLLLNAISMRAVLLKNHMGEPARELPQAWEMFVLYEIFSLAGGVLVGLPIALAFPVRVLSRLAWPSYLLIGAILGPLALLLIFVVMFGLQGQLRAFSLAHTESLWPLSILVSTVSFVVYAILLCRRFRSKERAA
jgi:hypothetical protein